MWDWAIATIYISLLIGAIVIGANFIRAPLLAALSEVCMSRLPPCL